MRKLLSFILGLFVSSQAQAADRWGVSTSEDDGKPLIYRYIIKPPSGIQISDYPDMIGISWEFDASIRNGMPDPTTNTRMIELEELLEKNLEGRKNAYLTLSVTGNGRKEWQWYSRSVDETLNIINEALTKKEPFPIRISSQIDPAWDAYFDVLKAMK